jgi:hypothetical protein
MAYVRHGRPEAAQLDLFGEVPVSLDDVLLWMLAVPRLSPDSPRFATYVRDYQVLDKIRAAKLSGTFDITVTAALRTLPIAAARVGPRRLSLSMAAANISGLDKDFSRL